MLFEIAWVVSVVSFIIVCIALFYYKEKWDNSMIENKQLQVELKKVKRSRSKMLVLLSQVYTDIDLTNGSLYHDTIKDIRKWVNG